MYKFIRFILYFTNFNKKEREREREKIDEMLILNCNEYLGFKERNNIKPRFLPKKSYRSLKKMYLTEKKVLFISILP